MNNNRLKSAKGFVKNLETGVIFPVFERETIRNIEIDNLNNKKLKRDYLIKFEIVTKSQYEAHKGFKKPGRPKTEK
jgi:hypothetical protein